MATNITMIRQGEYGTLYTFQGGITVRVYNGYVGFENGHLTNAEAITAKNPDANDEQIARIFYATYGPDAKHPLQRTLGYLLREEDYDIELNGDIADDMVCVGDTKYTVADVYYQLTGHAPTSQDDSVPAMHKATGYTPRRVFTPEEK